MSTNYFNICDPDYKGYAQIIHHASNNLYRIIIFEFDLDRDTFSYDSLELKLGTTNVICDLYLRQNGEQIEIETVTQAKNGQVAQNIAEKLKKRIDMLSELQQSTKQIQQATYKIEVSRPCGLEGIAFAIQGLYNVSVYASERKIVKGELDASCDDSVVLTLRNGKLTDEEFAAMFLHVLEAIRQKVLKGCGSFERTVRTNTVKPSMTQVGDAAFEYCYQSKEKIAVLIKDVESIDFDSDMIRITGKPYAIISVESQQKSYQVTLVDKNKSVDMEVLAPYLL